MDRNATSFEAEIKVTCASTQFISPRRQSFLLLRGKFGNIPSSDDFARRKQAEISRDEGRLADEI